MKESINRAEENAKIEIFFEKIEKEQPGKTLAQIFKKNTFPSSLCFMGNQVTGLFIENKTIGLRLIKIYDTYLLETILPKTKNSNRK